MEQKIRDALAELDVNNDEHWTAEGMPRLDVVKDFVGTAVSRADITAAAKGFTRKTPNLEVPEQAENTGSGESADEASAEQQEAQNENETSPTVPEVEEELESGSEAEVEAELKAAQDAVHKANDRLRAAQKAMDAVVDAKEKKNAGRTTAHDIKAYQDSQNRQRVDNARRRAAAAEALAAAGNSY